jgi:hypothetical protein
MSLLLFLLVLIGVVNGAIEIQEDAWSECLWCGHRDEVTQRLVVGEALFEYCWAYDDALILLEEERCHDAWRRYISQTDALQPIGLADDDDNGLNADDDDVAFGTLHFGTFAFGRAMAAADVYDAQHATATSMSHLERIYQLDRALGVERHVAVVRRTIDACLLARLMSVKSEQISMRLQKPQHSASSRGGSDGDTDDDDQHKHHQRHGEDDDDSSDTSSKKTDSDDHQLVSLSAKIARLRAICAAVNNGTHVGILKFQAPYQVLVLGTMPRPVRRPRPSVALALAAAVDRQSRARSIDVVSVEELYRYLTFVYLTDTWGRLRHTLIFQTADHNPNVLVVADKEIGGAEPTKKPAAARRFVNITAVILSATEIRPQWTAVRDFSVRRTVCELSCNETERTTACKGIDSRIDAEFNLASGTNAFDLFGPLLARVCDVPHQLEWRLESIDVDMILARKDLWADDIELRRVMQQRIAAVRGSLRHCADQREQLGCNARGAADDSSHVRQRQFAEAIELKLMELVGGTVPILLGADDSDEPSGHTVPTSSNQGSDKSASSDLGSTARQFLTMITTNQFSRWSPAVVRLRLKGCMLRRQMALSTWETGELFARSGNVHRVSADTAVSVFCAVHRFGHSQKLIFRARTFGMPFVVKMVPPMAITDSVGKDEAAKTYAANQENLRREQRVFGLLDKHHGIARMYASCASDEEPDLFDWRNTSIGEAARQTIESAIFGAGKIDFIVVEELQELTAVIEDGALATLPMLRDRLGLVRSIVELLIWLGTAAPGAPWHMCSLHARQFGVARSTETGLAEVRLLDADELFSTQYAGLEANRRDCAIADDAMVVGPTLVLEFVMPIWRPVQKTLPCSLRPLIDDTAWARPGFLQTALNLLVESAAQLRAAEDGRQANAELCDMSMMPLFLEHR